ncbi:iron-sulfur cluster repair di-iron protein [Algoriphagus sp. D3-2-R+10]|uniref:iron-sulfur cluster repair di-iron protein n=1 Tax=Algoriphagus aurantiacus TaxID=3103948 RepID=UPI002B366A5D|nr:iron-sulfur cluster repair di-iron protein [Algoriphagus sp. D3-2-R+10]MEB2775368.1 iron-sulfur cluster repair di-iron protein [Algoriphagus sp. D3-2-R+10]
MNEIAEKKVGNIVASNFRTAKIFTDYGIDFCCKGGIKLSEACEKKGVDLNKISAELVQSGKQQDEKNYQNFSMTDLVDHIVNVHHKYVETTIPSLKFYVEKIAKVHGDNHPELLEIRDEFFNTADALTSHMKKEEFVLFPYIKAMESAVKNHFPLSPAHFGSIENPISMMEEEHETEGDRFRKIAALSNNYTPPSDACQTYKVAFAMLQEFESDLHTHIHLENNILFPEAKEVFNSLNA